MQRITFKIRAINKEDVKKFCDSLIHLDIDRGYSSSLTEPMTYLVTIRVGMRFNENYIHTRAKQCNIEIISKLVNSPEEASNQ